MDNIQTTFNAWVGSNVTHLANASGTTIKVIISSKELQLTKLKVEGTIKYPPTLTPEIEFKDECVTSTFKINDRNFHRLERNSRYEYMTIQKVDGDTICENYKIGANKSYIILENEIVRQKYGSSNMFEDRYGKIH